jgi:hypothetical protein
VSVGCFSRLRQGAQTSSAPSAISHIIISQNIWKIVAISGGRAEGSIFPEAWSGKAGGVLAGGAGEQEVETRTLGSYTQRVQEMAFRRKHGVMGGAGAEEEVDFVVADVGSVDRIAKEGLRIMRTGLTRGSEPQFAGGGARASRSSPDARNTSSTANNARSCVRRSNVEICPKEQRDCPVFLREKTIRGLKWTRATRWRGSQRMRCPCPGRDLDEYWLQRHVNCANSPTPCGARQDWATREDGMEADESEGEEDAEDAEVERIRAAAAAAAEAASARNKEKAQVFIQRIFVAFVSTLPVERSDARETQEAPRRKTALVKKRPPPTSAQVRASHGSRVLNARPGSSSVPIG